MPDSPDLTGCQASVLPEPYSKKEQAQSLSKVSHAKRSRSSSPASSRASQSSEASIVQEKNDRAEPPLRASSPPGVAVSPSELETPVQFIKGVGPKLGAIFNKKDIFTVRELFLFLPRTYEDRSLATQVSEIEDGAKATLTVRVERQRSIPLRKWGKSMLEVQCTNESGRVSLKWFHAPKGLEKKLTPGTYLVVTGKVKNYQGQKEMVHPELTWGVQSELGDLKRDAKEVSHPHFGGLVPVYVEIEGVATRTLRSVIWTALEKFGSQILEDLPQYLLDRRSLPPLGSAIRDLHFPKQEVVGAPFGSQMKEQVSANPGSLAPSQAKQRDTDFLQSLVECQTPAHARLIYGEFFKFEYLILLRRLQAAQVSGPIYGSRAPEPGYSEQSEFTLTSSFSSSLSQKSQSKTLNGSLTGLAYVQSLFNRLPFELTAGQRGALESLLKDLSSGHPMNRLVQGDVGSGKTVVAFLSVAAVIQEGGQCALMVPTEILAEQHFQTAGRLLGDALPVVLVTGKTPQQERLAIQKRLMAGDPILVIGTHALLEDWVAFTRLDYVIIDEQHRFGVEQRRVLKAKGVRQDSDATTTHPHTLILTATPIPRTLALTAFGDLSVTSIKELPPGRSPVQTKVVRDASHKKRVYDHIREQIQLGRQAYFIFPLINDSEAEGFTQLKSAVAQAQTLATQVFPEFAVGLLHGQLSNDQKVEIMERFKNKELDILVSTTVVEVGVDVPNATVMSIEHAERFGLSQLHQLRGRVGRGKFQSYCYLFTSGAADSPTAERLRVMEQTQDGFQIAEADLKFRGPGEFLGVRQSGALPFRVANLVRDADWLVSAREDAIEILKTDPHLLRPEHARLKRYLLREGVIQAERLQTF